MTLTAVMALSSLLWDYLDCSVVMQMLFDVNDRVYLLSLFDDCCMMMFSVFRCWRCWCWCSLQVDLATIHSYFKGQYVWWWRCCVNISWYTLTIACSILCAVRDAWWRRQSFRYRSASHSIYTCYSSLSQKSLLMYVRCQSDYLFFFLDEDSMVICFFLCRAIIFVRCVRDDDNSRVIVGITYVLCETSTGVPMLNDYDCTSNAPICSRVRLSSHAR